MKPRVKEALALIADAKAPLDERLRYTRSFGEIKRPEAVPVLLKLATSEGEVDLRRARLRFARRLRWVAIAKETLTNLPRTPESVRPAALTLLGSRPGLGGNAHHGACSRAACPSRSCPAMSPTSCARTPRNPSRTAAVKLFPKVETAGMDFNARIASVEEALKKAPGNPYAGEPIYEQRCASCHKLFFKGGKIGPSSTAISATTSARCSSASSIPTPRSARVSNSSP